jgi:hypothetical protein
LTTVVHDNPIVGFFPEYLSQPAEKLTAPADPFLQAG